ncbi:PorT family protein [Hymenobacter perfusus]|uniref:PorT family protein n=1 Tax=Hymenobacter perfusus TaxID=1236770 RepID=A0A3R9NTQ4_9BACT|nr:PorT family protein [Hymenobacter perfusus]RSK43319.1 PorT family protein [Hymenobacter perfusus]
MTEHESEQLYQDLKRKLEGYGSAPPEAVWAAIREQVPAKQPRNWRPLLLLLLLAFVVGTVKIGNDYWHPFASLNAGSQAAQRTSSQPEADRATSRKLLPPAHTTAEPAALAESRAARAVTSAVSPLSGSSGNPSAESGSPILPAITARTKREQRTHNGVVVGAANGPDGAPRSKRRNLRRAVGLLAGTTKTARTSYPGLESEGNRRTLQRSGAARRSRTDLSPTAGEAAENPTTGDATAHATATRRSRQQAQKVSNEPLALLAIRPKPLEPAEPEVHAKRRARKRHTKQELRLRNWSAQLVLGPSLTYRFLGGSPTQLERLERPNLGFSGQATAAYAFSRQLTVAAGLGYAELANSLQYQLKKTSQENLLQKDFRDVYRFLTIPVQAQLTLQGNHRWRYGVLGGGNVAFLTGARTTEGSACNCGQRQWPTDAVNLPFRRLNLALTGGVFASYQFAPGQWLTIRPQGQVFLNSLTIPDSTRAPRRPWSTGVQIGYSWDLDPRKH